jgi:hypothetical protein
MKNFILIKTIPVEGGGKHKMDNGKEYHFNIDFSIDSFCVFVTPSNNIEHDWGIKNEAGIILSPIFMEATFDGKNLNLVSKASFRELLPEIAHYMKEFNLNSFSYAVRARKFTLENPILARIIFEDFYITFEPDNFLFTFNGFSKLTVLETKFSGNLSHKKLRISLKNPIMRPCLRQIILK